MNNTLVELLVLTLLLQGIAMSMYFNGELVLQNAITGIFTYEASVIDYIIKKQ